MYKVFGTKVCPHCTSAIKLLESKGIEYAYYDVSNPGSPTKAEFEALAKRSVRSVPIIIETKQLNQEITEGDIFVGGFVDLQLKLEVANRV